MKKRRHNITTAKVPVTLNLLEDSESVVVDSDIESTTGEFLDLELDTKIGSSPSNLASRLGKTNPRQINYLNYPISSALTKEQVQNCPKLGSLLEKASTERQIPQEKLEEIYSQNLDIKGLEKRLKSLIKDGLIPPALLDNILYNMETVPGFFGVELIQTLLKRKCISDSAHPLIIDKVLQSKNLNLIFEFIHVVQDLQESSFAKALSYVLNERLEDEKCLQGFTPKETALLALLEWNFDINYLTPHIRSLPSHQILELWTVLWKVCSLYSRIHADSFKPSSSPSWSVVPTRAQLIKWLQLLVTVNYPSSNDDKPIKDMLFQLRTWVESECLITDRLANLRAPLLTLSYIAKRYGSSGGPKDSLPSALQYEDYLIETVPF